MYLFIVSYFKKKALGSWLSGLLALVPNGRNFIVRSGPLSIYWSKLKKNWINFLDVQMNVHKPKFKSSRLAVNISRNGKQSAKNIKWVERSKKLENKWRIRRCKCQKKVNEQKRRSKQGTKERHRRKGKRFILRQTIETFECVVGSGPRLWEMWARVADGQPDWNEGMTVVLLRMFVFLDSTKRKKLRPGCLIVEGMCSITAETSESSTV